MPKIFIDTNIFLDLYRSHIDSLQILRELYKHSEYIVFPSLVYDEFLRNRDKIIKQVINSLRNEKPIYFTSAIVEGLEVFEDLKRSREEHKKNLDITISKMKEIKEDSKQDDVFLELSKLYKSEKIKIYEHDNSIISKAQRRHLLGQPPGTDKIKICDEVIWETILARIDDDIIIVSRDGTYQENYHYLSHEYEKRTDKKLLKVTDKINESLKLLGVEVPQKIIDLEEKQIDDLIWEKTSSGWRREIKFKNGGWDPNLNKYEWNSIPNDHDTTDSRNALHALIKTYAVTTDWLRKMDRKEAEEKLLKFQFPENNGEDTKE